MKKSSELHSLLVILTLTSLFFSVERANAEEQSPFTEIARERRYTGGPDESDLKVQTAPTTAAKNKPTSAQESNEGF